MPRRLSPEEKRKRLRALGARRDYEAADVDAAVEEALAEALVEFRQANAEALPPHIKAIPETPAEAAERGFRAGFLLAATGFWDDIGLARERRRTAGKGARSSAAQRRSSPDFEVNVRSEAAKYRSAHPYSRRHSTRAMALSIGRKLRQPDSTVRAALSRLRIR